MTKRSIDNFIPEVTEGRLSVIRIKNELNGAVWMTEGNGNKMGDC
jgi:hypothetical protein